MKKSLLILLQSIIMFSSCVKDNFDGPNARFFGSIRDKVTGDLVETDLINGSTIDAYELGFDDPISQKWVIMEDGNFRNNLVFANDYDLFLRNGNFYPVEERSFKIKAGDNEHHFQVIPFIRVVNSSIQHDKSGQKIVAKFNLQAGKDEVIVKNVRLYAFSDMHVGDPVKFDVKYSADRKENINKQIDSNEQYELSIDLAKNASIFKPDRDYFFRIGALASVKNVGTIRHNYAHYVKISL